MMNLDADEKEILDSFERGEWESVGASKREQKRDANYAEATFRRDQRVNIISENPPYASPMRLASRDT